MPYIHVHCENPTTNDVHCSCIVSAFVPPSAEDCKIEIGALQNFLILESIIMNHFEIPLTDYRRNSARKFWCQILQCYTELYSIFYEPSFNDL